MGDELFDVWLCRVPAGPLEPTAAGVAQLFGIDAALAARLVGAVPCVVKRRVTLHDAQTIASALQSIGGEVELRPSEPKRVSIPAPGSARPTMPSSPPPTLQLGTLDAGSIGFVPTLPPPSAAVTLSFAPPPTSVPASAPILAPAPVPLEVMEVVRHDPIGLEVAPVAAALDVDAASTRAMPETWRAALMLPASEPPPAPPSAVRSPNERKRPPRRQASLPAPKPRLSSEQVLTSLRNVDRGALAGHPFSGFLLVLGGTTLAFLAFYALIG